MVKKQISVNTSSDVCMNAHAHTQKTNIHTQSGTLIKCTTVLHFIKQCESHSWQMAQANRPTATCRNHRGSYDVGKPKGVHHKEPL